MIHSALYSSITYDLMLKIDFMTLRRKLIFLLLLKLVAYVCFDVLGLKWSSSITFLIGFLSRQYSQCLIEYSWYSIPISASIFPYIFKYLLMYLYTLIIVTHILKIIFSRSPFQYFYLSIFYAGIENHTFVLVRMK